MINKSNIQLVQKIHKLLENEKDRHIFLSEILEMSEREELLFNCFADCDVIKDDTTMKSSFNSVCMLEVNQNIKEDVEKHPNRYTVGDLVRKYNRTYQQVYVFLQDQNLLTRVLRKRSMKKKGTITGKVKNELFAFMNNN